MDKYNMVTKETLEKLMKCFTDTEEMQKFISHMDATTNELNFCMLLRGKVDDDSAFVTILKQVILFTLFCREHLELIHELVRNIDVKEISDKDFKWKHDA